MSLYPYNPKIGQVIQTNVEGVSVDRSFIAHFQVSAVNATVEDANDVLSTTALSATDPVVKTTGFTNPSIPRNIVCYLWGTDTDVKAVSVVLEGTNYAGEVITETLPAFTVNSLTHVTGVKAFKTVTKATIPAMDGAGVSITLGTGEVLGLPYKLSHNTVLKAYHNNVLEATAPTVTVSATNIELNTVDLNTALNGSIVDIYLMV